MRNFQCKLVRLNDLCDAGKSSLALTSFIKGLALIFQFEKKQKRGMHLSILSCVCGRINNKWWGKKVTSQNFGLGSVTKKVTWQDRVLWCLVSRRSREHLSGPANTTSNLQWDNFNIWSVKNDYYFLNRQHIKSSLLKEF